MAKGYVLPSIAAHNFETFQGMMANRLPHTYAEWADYMRFRLEQERARHPVLEIDVDPAEFARFVGGPPPYTYSKLVAFAAQKARDQSY